jgi:type IV pilus assembly protein PilA
LLPRVCSKHLAKIKRLIKNLNHGNQGFTLIEMLVVLAIFGVLASIVVLNVGKFIGSGKSEAYQTELHNIQTSLLVMLAESTTGLLDDTAAAVDADPTNATPTDDMTTIRTTDDTPLVLSNYLTGTDSDGKVKSGCTYSFGTDGRVLQTIP